MVEIGIVKKHIKDKGAVEVQFENLGTRRICKVLQQTTGDNNALTLPSIGTQVACWMDGGVYVVLGALYSNADKPPTEATSDGMYQQYGGFVMAVDGDKLSLKNDVEDLKSLISDIVSLVGGVQVDPGTHKLLGTVAAQAELLKSKIGNLLK